jgi:uncharacterized metal-binding protein YceD (DUF177 family)
MSAAAEFSRPVRLDTLGGTPRRVEIEADQAERAALALRFGFVSVDSLGAEADVVREGDGARARGRFSARIVQSCAATGTPVTEALSEPFDIGFRPRPEAGAPDEEIELSESELDIVFFDGAAIDLGEAVAEAMALAANPYPRAEGAEAALKAAGVKSEEEAGPFGALAGLRDKMKDKR